MKQERIYYAVWSLLNILVAKEVNFFVREPYMDEPFHIPQAQSYCAGEWSTWDPKLTTPPGLYLVSVVLKRIFILKCSTSNLRLTNLLFLLLLPIIVTHLLAHTRRHPPPKSPLDPSLESLIIASFPIAWFFGFLYYTDLGSLTLVLATVTAAGKQHHWLASLLGLFGCSFRQTNIVWILYAFGMSTLYTLHWRTRQNTPNPSLPAFYDPLAIDASPSDFLSSTKSLLQRTPSILVETPPYIAVISMFGGFVWWNGGIVLGDKSNHTPSFHIPQVYYFIAFSTIFAFPVLLSGRGGPASLGKQVLHRMGGSIRALLQTFIIVVVMMVTIHKYTIHHPFLLSDNRHYTFYVWRRVFMFHPLVPYLLTPGYLACAWAWFLRLGETNYLLQTLLLPICVVLTLLPTPLLEPRYFLIPYVLLRCMVSSPSTTWALAAEGAWYTAINWATMYAFLHMERKGVGRFMW